MMKNGKASANRDASDRLPLSVVVPVRNAVGFIEACLETVQRNRPGEIIIIDGRSEDDTVRLAQKYADVILSDEGNGVAFARNLGAEAARHPHVAFIDVDVELPDGALEGLLDELHERDLEAIHAGLRSVGANDYWSRALAAHHNGGRSRRWFGLSITIFQREMFLRFGLDSAFRTGEDIELRYRLQKAGAKIGTSERIVVQHRFGEGFRFALDQWLADGAGLGRMVRKHGMGASAMLLIPAAGTVLGLQRTIFRKPAFIPYYCLYAFFNYVAIFKGLFDRRVHRAGSPRR